jgi:hypothetical protein
MISCKSNLAPFKGFTGSRSLLSVKTIRRVACQRDDHPEDRYSPRAPQYVSYQLVSIDEFGCAEIPSSTIYRPLPYP